MLGPGATPVAGMLVMVGANTAAATQGLNSVSQQMNTVAKGGQNAAGGLNSAMGLASAAIVGIGVASVKSAMTFEQSMRNVNSVAHLPEDQFQKLQDDVISFALTTRSSADNVAKSLYMVASAGLELDEKVKSVTVQTADGAVQMSEAMAVMQASSRAAGAGLADVDEVSKLLISTLRAYNMDAGQSGHVTDVFLKVVQSGLVTLPQLAGVMGRLAPLAANLGVSVEEMGYSFAQMTNTGLTAEQAATRLNAIFTQMIKPSEGLQNVIEKLGYSSGTTLIEGMGGVLPALKAVTQTVFESTESIGGMTKAQTTMSLKYPFLVDQMDIYKQELAKITEKEGEGSLAAQKKRLAMDKLNATMTQYQGELAKTSPVQQRLVKEFYGTNEGIAELFRNVRAIGGVMALTADETTMSAEAFEEWKGAIEGSVDAARAEQYKSLETQIKRLKVAFNVLGIEIGLTLIPPLTALMDKVIIPLVRGFLPPLRAGLDALESAFKKLPEPIQGITTGLLALIFALKGAQFVLRPFLGMFGIQVGALTRFIGPLSLVTAGVVAFGIAYKNNLFGLKDATDNFVANGKSFLNYLEGVVESGDAQNDWLTHLPEQYQAGAKAVGDFMVNGRAFLDYMGAVAKDGDIMNDFLTRLPAAWLEAAINVGVAISRFRDAWTEFDKTVRDNLTPAWEAIQAFFSTGTLDTKPFENILRGLGKAIDDSFGYVLRMAVDWIVDNAPVIRDAFLEWVTGAVYWVGQAGPQLISAIGEMIANALGWIVGTGVPTLIGGGVLLIQGLIDGMKKGTSSGDLLSGLAATIGESAGKISAALEAAGANIAGHVFTGFQQALVTLFGQTQANSITAGVVEVLNRLETIFKPTFDRIGAAAKGFGDEMALLKPKFDELMSAVTGLVGPASVIGQVLAGLAVVISKLFGEVIGQAIERIPEIIGGVLDYLSATVTTFTNVFMGVVTVIKALFAGDLQGALGAGKQALSDFVTGSAAQLIGLLVVVDNVVGGLYDAVVNTIRDLTGATLPSWDELKNGIVERFESIKSSITGVIDEIDGKVQQVATALQPVFEILGQVFADIKTGFQEFLLELGPISMALAPIKEAVSGAFEGLKDALEVAKPALLWLRDALLTVSGIILGVIGGSVVATVVAFGEILSGIFRNAGTIIRGFGMVLAGVFDVLRSIFYSFISVVKSIFEGDMDGATKAGLTAFEAFKDGIAGIFNGIGNIILGAFGAIYDSVTGIANRIPGVALPAWEEVSRGFEFGADKIKGSAESAATALSTASGNMATSASTASTAIGGSLSTVAGSVDTAKTSYTDFAGYTSTYMTQAAGTTQTYSDQMIAAFGKLPPAAVETTSQVAMALSGIPTAAQTAQADTETATTSLIDGILGKMNSLAGQVTGPQQTFDDLQATVSGSSAAIQTDLDTMLSGWNSTFTEMSTAPVVAGQTMATGWQTGVESLAPITTTALAATSAAATTGFQAVQFAGDTALAAMNLNATTQMAALNTTVNTGLLALQTSAATNYTALQTQDMAYQTTTTTGQQAFYTALATQDLTYQTNALLATQTFVTDQVTAWQAMSTGVQGRAFAMTTMVQARFAEFLTWLNTYLTVLLVPAVRLSFDMIYLTVVTQMAAAASAMLAGWLSMLGGTRSQLTAMRGEVNSQMAGMVGELRGYAGEMFGVGSAIGQGLADGIQSKIGAAITAAVALVQAAIAAAWAAALAQSPSRIMMELGGYFGQGFSIGIEDQGPSAASASASMVSGAIGSAKDAAGIHSPSDLMKTVGFDFVMGMVEGMTAAEQEALKAGAELIDKLMGTISNSVKALSDLATFRVQPLDLSGFKTQVKLVIREIAALAVEVEEILETLVVPAQGTSGSATTLMDPLADFFSKLSNVVSGIKSIFDPVLLEATVSEAEQAMALLLHVAKILVVGFATAAKELDTVAWPAAVALASVAGNIAGNIKSVVEAIDALSGLISGRLDVQIATVVSFVSSLVTAFSAAGNLISFETAGAAEAFSALASSVVAPIVESVAAIESLLSTAAFDASTLAAAGSDVVNGVVSLGLMMADAASVFDKPTRKAISQVGETLQEIAAPWKAGIEALVALSGFVGSNVEPAARQIAASMGILAQALIDVANTIGVDVLAQSAKAADLFVSVLAPWELAVKTLTALVEFVFRPIGPTAEKIGRAVQGLSVKMVWIATTLGPQTMALSKAGAELFGAVLDPWKVAAETFRSLAEFIFRPIDPVAEKIKNAVFGLALKLRFIAAELGPQVISLSKEGASLMGDVLKPWKDAIDTFTEMAGFVFRRIGPAAEGMIDATMGLASKLRWMVLDLGPELMALSKEGAALMAAVLEPWQDAISTFRSLAEFVFRPIGPTAERIKDAVFGLARKLNFMASELGPDMIAQAKVGAALMVEVLTPWQDAVKTFGALAEFIFRPIGPTAERIKDAVYGLSRKLNFMVSELGPEMVAQAKAGAALMSEVLTPWADAIDTFVALAEFIFRPIGPAAEKIKDAVYGLARKLNFMVSELGPELMALSKEGAALMVDVLKPWKDAIDTFTAMAGFTFRRIGPAAEGIKDATMGLASKLRWMVLELGPEVMALSKEGAAIMAAVLEPWADAVSTFSALAEFIFRPIGPVAERIKDAVYGLTRKLNFMVSELGPEMIGQAEIGSALMVEVLTPWQAAVDTFSALAEFIFRPIGPAAERIKDAVYGLSRKLGHVATELGPQTIALAKEGAALFVTVLEPWQDAIETLEALADFVFKPIGPVAEKIVLAVGGLALKLARVVFQLGPQVIALAKEGAALFSAVLVPWQDAVDTLEAIADYTFVPIAAIADKIVLSVGGLALKLAQVAFHLGPQAIALAKEGALLFSAVLEPWQQGIDVLNALAGYIARNVSEAANTIISTIGVLARALAGMADEIGMDVLKRAAKVGKLLSEVLDPWEQAIKIADEMRAFRIMPDFVDKMVRFGKQWIDVVDQLGKILLTLNQDGLDAVEDFAAALTALTSGIISAMEIIQAGAWPTPDPSVWDAFVAWIWGIFRSFYDLLDDFMSDPDNVIGFDPVVSFASALESILSSLAMALEIAQNFAFIEPPVDQWDAFIAWVWNIFQTFYNLLDDFMADPSNVIDFDPVVAFATALEAILSSLAMALEVARNFSFIEPPQDQWAAFVTWVWGVFQTFYNLLDDFMADPANIIDFDPVEAFGSALESIMGGLQTALDLARSFAFIEPPADLWSSFVTWVWGVFQTFYNLLDDFIADPANIIDFDPVESFGSALESIMGGLAASLELITGFSFTDPDPSQWDAFIAWVIQAFTTLYNYVEAMNTDPTHALNFDPEESFGSALESIMGGLAATIELITGFVWVAPNPEIWSDFIEWVVGFMHDLQVMIETTFPGTVAGAATFAPVQAFGDAIEAVMGGLQAALEFLEGLAGFIPPSQTTIQTFLGNVEFLIGLVATYATSNLDPARVIAIRRFSEAVSAVSGGLADALDLFEGLASLDDRTIDWLTNAGAGTGTNTGVAMQIIGYLFMAIVQTLERFHTEVVTRVGTDWIPTAQAFYNAMESVITLLSDALALFTDLGTSGMPSTAEIEAFVQAIMQVFTTFNTGLASTLAPLHTTIVNIQTELSGNLAGWLSYNAAAIAGRMFYDSAALVGLALDAGLRSVSLVQPSLDLREQIIENIHGWFAYHAAAQPTRTFFEDGRNVVLSIGAGMLDEEDYIFQVAWDIGQAIINGLEGSLQIGSPSQLAMEAGWFTSNGLALGLLSGKDDAVNAAREVADAVAAEYMGLPDDTGRVSPLWPNLSSTAPSFSTAPPIEHEITIHVEGGDRLPKMSDYEMREFARELSRHIKNGG